jgi:phenylacetate-CoA ligase
MNQLISNKFAENELVKGSSSGTTGIPINYFKDIDSISAGFAAAHILWSMGGQYLGEKNVHIWGNNLSVQRWSSWNSRIKNCLINQKNIASVDLNHPARIEKIAQGILSFQPKSIEGYTSSIYTLADYFIKNNLKINSLKRVITTAENLEDYQKKLLKMPLLR